MSLMSVVWIADIKNQHKINNENVEQQLNKRL